MIDRSRLLNDIVTVIFTLGVVTAIVSAVSLEWKEHRKKKTMVRDKMEAGRPANENFGGDDPAISAPAADKAPPYWNVLKFPKNQ